MLNDEHEEKYPFKKSTKKKITIKIMKIKFDRKKIEGGWNRKKQFNFKNYLK